MKCLYKKSLTEAKMAGRFCKPAGIRQQARPDVTVEGC